MTRKGPLLTLLGGAALAIVLLVASIEATPEDSANGDLVAGQASPTPAPAPTGTPTPPPTAEPDPDQEVEPVTYVGDVDGGGASVGIVITGEEATAYVCDGDTVEAWLEGTARDGELRLEGDDAELVASFDEAAASGRTTVNARTFTFSVPLVEGTEGLYRFASTVVGGAEVQGGWILMPDGRQVGITTVDGTPRPAPRLNPETGKVVLEGTVVTADKVG